MWASIVVKLLAYGPTIFGDAEQLFASIAKGPGGAQKISNVAASLGHLAEHAAAAAADNGINPPPPATDAQQQQPGAA